MSGALLLTETARLDAGRLVNQLGVVMELVHYIFNHAMSSTVSVWKGRLLEDVRGGQFLFVEFLFEGFSSPFRDDFGVFAFATPTLSSVNKTNDKKIHYVRALRGWLHLVQSCGARCAGGAGEGDSRPVVDVQATEVASICIYISALVLESVRYEGWQGVKVVKWATHG